MQAICYSCGASKSSPLKVCGGCHTAPSKHDDQILSLCLSLECVKQDTLGRCRKYFEKKKRPPRFKEKIVKLAEMLLDEQLGNSASHSLEFSSSLFEFPELIAEDAPRKKLSAIMAFVIGKGPNQDEADGNVSIGKAGKTFHTRQWLVGEDISKEMYESNKGFDGEVYVWYRWINNRWTWTCVGKAQFDQMKSLEVGRLA